jgi:hypothetical protein|tara:strand:- start:10957 stop:11640 length:684 start_codon:yes stop_codon:yes gene_type:complete
MGKKIGRIIGAKKAAANAQDELQIARDRTIAAQTEMNDALESRQDIINPYAGITDLSGLARDLTSQITNPFNNLTVSTAAAKMQAEETDVALANTLDTLEQTGASAGGATALAMAALKSKQSVAATIEKQEAANDQLQAQGEAQMNREKVAASQAYDQATIQLKGRKEEADAKGEIFEFQAQEARTNGDINRYTSMYLGASQAEQETRQAAAEAESEVGNAWGGLFG